MTKEKAVRQIPQRRRSDLAVSKIGKKHASPPSVASNGGAVAQPVVETVAASLEKERRLCISIRMTETQAALIDQMKARCARMGMGPRKGEILYAGLQLLNRLSEGEFEAVIRPLVKVPKFKKNTRGKKKVAAITK